MWSIQWFWWICFGDSVALTFRRIPMARFPKSRLGHWKTGLPLGLQGDDLEKPTFLRKQPFKWISIWTSWGQFSQFLIFFRQWAIPLKLLLHQVCATSCTKNKLRSIEWWHESKRPTHDGITFQSSKTSDGINKFGSQSETFIISSQKLRFWKFQHRVFSPLFRWPSATPCQERTEQVAEQENLRTKCEPKALCLVGRLASPASTHCRLVVFRACKPRGSLKPTTLKARFLHKEPKPGKGPVVPPRLQGAQWRGEGILARKILLFQALPRLRPLV